MALVEFLYDIIEDFVFRSASYLFAFFHANHLWHRALFNNVFLCLCIEATEECFLHYVLKQGFVIVTDIPCAFFQDGFVLGLGHHSAIDEGVVEDD